jgi:catechol 2,3-dioxygenase-like lactoylglutathione lyase family enzyme
MEYNQSMKLKSISGIVFYVKDVEATATFYEALGFIITEKTESKVAARLNWFWLEFHAAAKETKEGFKAEANAEHKGAGEYLYVSVYDVDAVHKELISQGLKPSSEPRDWPWGNREFVIRDPDGYKLVLFQKLKK